MGCIAVLTGCNIKEDRMHCPCRLTLNLAKISIASGDMLELYLTSSLSLHYSHRFDSLSIGEEISIDVPRLPLRLMAWNGLDGMAGPDGMVIPLGNSCPRVFIYGSEINAAGEECRDTLYMRKNHCILDVDFRHGEGGSLVLSVRGNVCGYDATGKPVEGPFSAEAKSSEDSGSRRVILPRQCGGELYLDVTDENGKVRSFPLSSYIESAGYDWNAPDLADLRIIIDFVQTTVSLVVQGWDEEFFFDVVL